MKFSTVLIAVVGVLLLGASAAWLFDPGTGLDADAWTYAAVIAHLLVLVALTAVARAWGHGLLLLVVAAAILALGQSMVALLWDFTAFNLYRLRAPTADEFTRAAWWATAGTVALAAGVALAGNPLPTPRATAARPDAAGGRPLLLRAQGFLVGVTVVVLLLNMLLTATAGVGVAGAAGGGGRLAALANLFSRDLGMLLVLVGAVRYWPRFGAATRQATIAAVALYLLVTIYQGSRGGLLLLVVMAMVTMVVERGDFFIPRRVLVAMFAAAAVTGLVVWPLATRIRTTRVVESTGAVVDPGALPVGGSTALDALVFIKPIAERQGRMAQLIAVSNDWVPGARADVRASGMFLNTVAGLFPGPNPDPEVYPLIGRAYAVIFLQSPRDQVFAEEWSPVGLMLFFLPGPAALLALLAWGAATGALVQALRAGTGGLAYVLRVIFVYNLGFSLFAGAVIDVLAPQFIRWTVLAGAVLVVHHVLEQLSAAAFARREVPRLGGAR